MTRPGRLAGACVATLVAALPPGRASAQDSARGADVAESCIPTRGAGGVDLPFVAGERLRYDLTFGPITVGHGSMELETGDTIRGRATLHATMRISGGTPFFHVRDRIESWFDARTLVALRFAQQIHEGGYHANRIYDIDPDRAVFARRGRPETPSVAEPLDDVSFLYFLRTLPLLVGSRYTCDRYFQTDANPVVIRVLERDRVHVPAGDFDAVVLQPLIRTHGMFSQAGDARVWLNAGGAHELLQLKTHLVFGSLNLYLSRIERASAPTPDSEP